MISHSPAYPWRVRRENDTFDTTEVFREPFLGRISGDEEHSEPFVVSSRWITFSGVDPSLDLRPRFTSDDGFGIRVSVPSNALRSRMIPNVLVRVHLYELRWLTLDRRLRPKLLK